MQVDRQSLTQSEITAATQIASSSLHPITVPADEMPDVGQKTFMVDSKMDDTDKWNRSLSRIMHIRHRGDATEVDVKARWMGREG